MADTIVHFTLSAINVQQLQFEALHVATHKLLSAVSFQLQKFPMCDLGAQNLSVSSKCSEQL